MASVGLNALANLVGRFWSALMSFAFVPVYIHLLGIEAYGLIGFFASMMGAFAVLDLGLGVTVNRELSRAAANGSLAHEARDLLRTLEVIYWVIAFVLGVSIVLSAPLIVDHWLNVRSLDRDTVVNGVRAMGVTALLRWPVALYFGAMMGMQKQVRLNIVTSIAASFSGLGAVIVLELISRNVATFFLWQAVIAGCQVVTLRVMAWKFLTMPGHTPKASRTALRASFGFSAAMTGITLLSVILTQLDKFILVRLLPLDAFGYYALAGAIAGMLTTAGAAVESATFPALSRLVAAGDAVAERRLYHQASQALALLVVPATMTIVLFSRELLTVYVREPAIATASAPILSVLAAGNGILALMFMPLSLQLSNGWTRLSLVKNIIAVIAFVPVLYGLVLNFGAIGAAWTWLLLTVGYFLIEVPVMHRRLLPGAQWRWYVQDIGVPVVISVMLIGGVRMLLPTAAPMPVQIAIIAAAAWLALISSAVALPSIRHILVGLARRRTAVT